MCRFVGDLGVGAAGGGGGHPGPVRPGSGMVDGEQVSAEQLAKQAGDDPG
jgi:hypothetical protein